MWKLRGLWRGSAPADAALEPVDLTAPTFIADPGPTYDRLRRDAPVAAVRSGGVLLTRHADITAALSDPRLGNAPSRFSVLAPRNRNSNTLAAIAAHIPPFQDRPEHIETRRAVSAAFHVAFDGASDWVAQLASDSVASRSGTTCDLVADIARPFACTVMARFLGLPLSQTEVKSATQAFFHLFAPISDRNAFQAAGTSLDAARLAISAACGARSAPSGFAAQLQRMGLPPDAVVDNILLILADGVENIEAGIASAFDILASEAITLNDMASAQPLVTECLRLASPAQIIPRVARQDCALHDVPVKEGMPVLLALGAANLDPAAHPDPAAFRPDRSGAPPLIFGRGRHVCIGTQLAMLQISAMLLALHAAGAQQVPGQTLTYQPRFGHRWPAAMPLRIP